MSLNSNKQNQIIAFQPLDDYNEQEIDSIVKEVSRFYNKQVIALKPIEIVGLTHKPIFTMKDAKPVPYFDEKVFGMGYQPGNSCIVSDFKFGTTNVLIYNHRVKTVILHEIGHNLGLSHCKDDKCIMSENNGDLMTLDRSSNEYCAKCKKTLND